MNTFDGSTRSESGVAMITVLFIGAVLTVVASSAAFLAIGDLRAGADDRRGAQALSYGEAAIDRMMLEIRGGRWTWKQLMTSGCSASVVAARGFTTADFPLFTGSALQADGRSLAGASGGDIGDGGRYRAEIRNPAANCGSVVPRPKGERTVEIHAIGEHPTARREIVQVVRVRPKGLPVGLYASFRGEVNGSGLLENINLISPGVIEGRDQIAFRGVDPYYEKSDFYPCTSAGNPAGCFPEDGNEIGDMPASAHTSAQITCQNECPPGTGVAEHDASRLVAGNGYGVRKSPNCKANRETGAVTGGVSQPPGDIGASLWDSSGWTTNAGDAVVTGQPAGCNWTIPSTSTLWNQPWSGNAYPNTSLFTSADARRLAPTPELSEEDYQALRAQAQVNGILCEPNPSGDMECRRQGVLRNNMVKNTGVDISGSVDSNSGDVQNLPKVFVAYIAFPAGATEDNLLNWGVDQAVGGNRNCVEGANHRSVTIVVRNGHFNGGGNIFVNGSVIAPDGVVDLDGGYKVNGTVIAREIEIISGAWIRLDECWVNNLQTAGLTVIPTTWTEVDR